MIDTWIIPSSHKKRLKPREFDLLKILVTARLGKRLPGCPVLALKGMLPSCTFALSANHWKEVKKGSHVDQKFLQTWNNLFHWWDFLIGSPGKFVQSAKVKTVSKSSAHSFPCFWDTGQVTTREMPLSKCVLSAEKSTSHEGRKT